MSAMDSYMARMSLNGEYRRAAIERRTAEYLNRNVPNSLSYKTVRIDGNEQNVTIHSSEERNIKKICSMPGERIPHGGLVEWENNMWIITELDADTELYCNGLMKQCNYVLRWINDDGVIIERWSIVEDGTKYLIGETNEDVMSTGAARISVTVSRDFETANLNRGKRFIIDDPDTLEPLCYEITKPNRFFNVYNEAGIVRFILVETNLTSNDNLDLRIADFFNRAPIEVPKETPTEGKVSWL